MSLVHDKLELQWLGQEHCIHHLTVEMRRCTDEESCEVRCGVRPGRREQ